MEAARFVGPLRISSERWSWREILATLALGAAAGVLVATVGDWKIPLAVTAAAGLLLWGVLAPAAFLGVLLLARPLVDNISENSLVAGVNAAGCLALLVIAIAVIQLGPVRVSVPRLPHLDTAFAAVLALSALAAVLALANYGGEVGTKPVAELARLAAMFAVYLLGSRYFNTPERVRTLFLVVGLSAVIPALVGLIQWASGVTVDPQLGFGRLSGTFFDSNAFGPYLAVAAVILIVLPRSDLPTWVRLAALAPIVVALFGTYSRTGYLMFAIPLVLLGLRRYTALTVVMLVALAIVLPGVSGFDQRVVRSDLSQKYGPTPNSVEYRILAWGRLLHVYAQSPLVGYGLRTTELVNPSKGSATTSASGANPTGRIGANPHSSVIRPLVEGGPLLLASWIALFVVLIAGLRRLARGESEVRPYARILLVLWIAVAIAGVASGDIVGFTALMFALLALTGAVGAAFQQLRPKAATSSDAHHGAH